MRRHALALALALLPSLALAQQINDVQQKPGSSAIWGAIQNQTGLAEVSQYNTSGSVVDSFRWLQGANPASATFLYSVSPTGSVFGTATGGRQGAGTINAQGLFVNGVAAVSSAGGTNGQIQYNNAGTFGGFTTSGDATINTGTGALTLATVNAGVGTFGSATSCITTTANAKGLITAISAATCTPAIGSITGLGTGIATALGINVGSAGAPILFNGAGGTPSSMTGTNITGLNATQLTTGTVPGARLATATKADQQAGSSTTLVVTPSQQQQHDSAAKAWVMFTGSGSNGAQTVNASYNVSGVSRTSLGTYVISFTTAFAATTYACSNVASNVTVNAVPFYTTKAVGSITAQYVQLSPVALIDPVNGADVICYGRQ